MAQYILYEPNFEKYAVKISKDLNISVLMTLLKRHEITILVGVPYLENFETVGEGIDRLDIFISDYFDHANSTKLKLSLLLMPDFIMNNLILGLVYLY